MCEIQIFKVTGIGPGPSSITVLGNVQRCDSGIEGEPPLVVQITCPIDTATFFGPSEPFQGTVFDATSVFIAANGDFFATFETVGDCRCGGPLLASAHCAAEPDCRDEMPVEELECTGCPEEVQGIDDVDASPECEEGATAIVALSRTFFNPTDQTTFLMRIVPGHPDGEIVSVTEEQINPGQTRTVTAVVRYPTRSTPQPYVVALDTQENPTGCPPWFFTPKRMPDCCPDAEITNVEIDGCMVVVNVDPVAVPDGCDYFWNFDADREDSPWFSGPHSQRAHQYDDNGEYKIRVEVRCGRCSGEADERVVEITDCEGKETPRCQAIRLFAAVAAALGIFAAAMAICLPQIAPLLLGIAALFGIASALLFWWHSGKTCKSRTCRPKTLALAQASLMAGFALIQFSSPECCPSLLGIGLATVGFGLALLNYWRGKCHKTWCQYMAKFMGVLAGYGMVFGILKSAIMLDELADLAPCYNDEVTGYIFLFLSAAGVIGGICFASDEEDSEFV